MKTLRIMGLLFALITLSIAPTTSNAQKLIKALLRVAEHCIPMIWDCLVPLIFTQHMVFNLTHTFMWVQVLEYV